MPLHVYGRVDLVIEHILQLFEEALALFVVILFHAVLKSFQGFALGAGDLFRDLNIDDHILVAAAAAVFLAAALAWVWPVRASWHANLGAVTQARAELGRVPPEAPVAPDLREAEGRFRRALTVDPRHPTASVRLALMEMDAGRFEAAAGYAEPAWRADRLSVRTRKALGLARMWAGDLDGAHPLLDGLPGLVGELNAWGFWRSRRHEPVLALRAYTMSLLLEPDQPAVRRAAASLSQIGGKAPSGCAARASNSPAPPNSP